MGENDIETVLRKMGCEIGGCIQLGENKVQW